MGNLHPLRWSQTLTFPKLEIERLEDQHHLLDFIFDEKLVLPPSYTLPSQAKVLDCGFGGGSWAVEVAENYPLCEVNVNDPIA